jgi:ribosomal protein S21
MHEHFPVQNSNLNPACTNLKKILQKTGKFASLKEKERFIPNPEKRRKKEKKRIRSYIELHRKTKRD